MKQLVNWVQCYTEIYCYMESSKIRQVNILLSCLYFSWLLMVFSSVFLDVTLQWSCVTFVCWINSLLLLKVFEQNSHFWVFFFSLCTFTCCFKWNLNLKLSEQMSHLNSFGGCTSSWFSIWDSMLDTDKQLTKRSRVMFEILCHSPVWPLKLKVNI